MTRPQITGDEILVLCPECKHVYYSNSEKSQCKCGNRFDIKEHELKIEVKEE